ncbi:DUF2877 domain-containing protein [Phycicoccus endophyticus]|uniref:DUF2877 domain-containing protein n=1 Tax=Phycicoccus endophyticus TaxID=1690220 RepID=A0A7G9R2S1_9MICO|nr:DUF2877 domain-containing protein [Phycicoccus endophyticus]NHI20363.1 DUF2877 domain-containing protein [Phycicoccus endophyticus]QNN49896.1 DUF2877 domain-containing protein [Phycicoccus endophyticus]GGL29830.1 hypothetical protein GCM10012283_10250 [Phycicoccus endophyticus]
MSFSRSDTARRGPAAPVLPGALSPLTADLVHGPRRVAVVLGAYRVGVYLGVGGRVLPVLAADGLALPGALRLAETSAALDLGAVAGDRVVLGAGTVGLAGVTVRGVRTWRPARVRAGAVSGGARQGRAVRSLLDGASAEAPGWLARGVRGALGGGDPHAAVHALVGRGPGLTPSGDDALAGGLLVRRARGAALAAGDPLLHAVRGRLGATTAVSASLLAAAGGGWATPEAVRLVDAAARADLDAVEAALPAVLALGHTSGRDLVAGVAAALGALDVTSRSAA